jgi:hypothetical protein
MGRKKIDKLEKPLELDYIWGDKENETEGFGTLGITLHSRYYLSLPCYGFRYNDSFEMHPFGIICHSAFIY